MHKALIGIHVFTQNLSTSIFRANKFVCTCSAKIMRIMCAHFTTREFPRSLNQAVP